MPAPDIKNALAGRSRSGGAFPWPRAFAGWCMVLMCFVPPAIFGQSLDTLQVMHGNDWRTTGKWFGTDTVVMVAIGKLDMSGQAVLQRTIRRGEEEWGERLWFDKAGHFGYRYVLSCPVGEILRKVNRFEVAQGHVVVDYELETWNGDPVSSGHIRYHITELTPSTVMLVRADAGRK